MILSRQATFMIAKRRGCLQKDSYPGTPLHPLSLHRNVLKIGGSGKPNPFNDEVEETFEKTDKDFPNLMKNTSL